MNSNDKEKYWNGIANRVVRYYFYCNRGLALLNEFRYLLMGILAVYALLKLDNPWIMLIMFVVAVPVLCFLGWIFTHYMAKTMDFLNINFSTHFSKYIIEMQERQVKALENIDEKMGSRQ
jgi:hypothetical protein